MGSACTSRFLPFLRLVSFKSQEISRPCPSVSTSPFFELLELRQQVDPRRGRLLGGIARSAAKQGQKGRVAWGWTPTILNSWSVRGDHQGNRTSITNKGARRTQDSPSGGPNGSDTSHGTRTAYPFQYSFGKNFSISTTAMSAEGLSVRLCARAMESTLLPPVGVPLGTASLAGSQTPTATAKPSGGPPATRRSRTPTPWQATRRGPC